MPFKLSGLVPKKFKAPPIKKIGKTKKIPKISKKPSLKYSGKLRTKFYQS